MATIIKGIKDVEAAWNGLGTITQGSVTIVFDKTSDNLFWDFEYTVAGKKTFGGHLNLSTSFENPHVTLVGGLTGGAKINYWFTVGKGGAIDADGEKGKSKKHPETHKHLGQLPEPLKTPLLAQLQFVFNGYTP